MRPITANLRFFLLIFAIAITTSQTTVGQNLYSLTAPADSLGTQSAASGINNLGQITGLFFSSPESGVEVFFWDPESGASVISGPEVLTGSVSDNYSAAINDSGLVVGSFRHFDLSTGVDTFLRPFTWTSETGTDIFTNSHVSQDGRVLAQVFGSAVDVNNSGTVLSSGSLWLDGVAGLFDLIVDDQSQSTHALSAINDLGQVVGQALSQSGTNAFIWDPTSGVEFIETPFSITQVVIDDLVAPRQLNNKGQVVGLWCRYVGPLDLSPDVPLPDDLFERTAFSWSDGQITDLGALPGLSHSDAKAINEDSIKVGLSSNGINFSADSRAVIWDSKNIIMDLNNLLDETGDGWTLLEASDINDAGQIVGLGINPAGVRRAFLLTPALVVGDCNQDGDVDFADIASFINILSTGRFLQQADCNRDGDVNFADIRTFINILSGV